MSRSSAKVAALDLGMQTVTMAVFDSSAKGDLTISSFAQADLLPDPAADATRNSQVRVVLGELSAKNSWKGGRIGCAIPSQGVFARFVQIPQVEHDKIDQMLFFEAQQNVPYPIEEVAWSYQVLPKKHDEKLSALIMAAKADALGETVQALEAAKLAPEVIETATSALYNAFRYNYPEARGCSLIIDIGARTTNLLFVEEDDLFIRTLPIGGNSITAALQKRFESRSFQEVEDFKRAEGMIPPPGNFAGAQSEDVVEMGKIARTVMTRIHNEITRSITFYRTNQKGASPTQAYLAGGGVSLPYSLEFFNEKLSLPIEFFNPLRRLAIGSGVSSEEISQSAHRLGPCVGLALTASGADCPLQIGFKSEYLEDKKADLARRPFLIAAAALLVAGLGILGFSAQQSANKLRAINEQLSAQIQPLQAIDQELKQVKQEREKLLQDEAEFAALPHLRTAWVELINELNAKQPEKFLWVTQLAPFPAVPGFGGQDEAPTPPSGNGRNEGDRPEITALSVAGLYLENPAGPGVIDAFVDALSASELFDITPENKADVIRIRATPTGESWAYEYQLMIPLIRPITL
jgi:type IV pilus assembly protein PilM